MKISTKTAFTLIELIVAMSIFFIMSIGIYAPYSYYQQKGALKLGIKELELSILEARNLAVHGTSSGSNVSVGLYLDTSDEKNNTITFLSYPYSFSGSQISREISGEITELKVLLLQSGVKIDMIGGQNNALFFFEAISGETKQYYWDLGLKEEFSSLIIPIQVSYKKSSVSSLQKTLNYYTQTHIIDY